MVNELSFSSSDWVIPFMMTHGSNLTCHFFEKTCIAVNKIATSGAPSKNIPHFPPIAYLYKRFCVFTHSCLCICVGVWSVLLCLSLLYIIIFDCIVAGNKLLHETFYTCQSVRASDRCLFISTVLLVLMFPRFQKWQSSRKPKHLKCRDSYGCVAVS